jgi:hypothetical protein
VIDCMQSRWRFQAEYGRRIDEEGRKIRQVKVWSRPARVEFSQRSAALRGLT